MLSIAELFILIIAVLMIISFLCLAPSIYKLLSTPMYRLVLSARGSTCILVKCESKETINVHGLNNNLSQISVSPINRPILINLLILVNGPTILIHLQTRPTKIYVTAFIATDRQGLLVGICSYLKLYVYIYTVYDRV